MPPYEILDEILYYLIEKEFSLEEICKKGFKSSVVKKIRNLLVKSEYKRRQAPPGVKICNLCTSLSFGFVSICKC